MDVLTGNVKKAIQTFSEISFQSYTPILYTLVNLIILL